MNKPTVNIYMQFLYRHKFSTHLGKYQEVQLLDYRIRICLVLLETAKRASRVAAQGCIPTSTEQESL